VTDEVNVISVGVISQSHAIIYSKLEVTLYYLSPHIQHTAPYATYQLVYSLQLCIVVQHDTHIRVQITNTLSVDFYTARHVLEFSICDAWAHHHLQRRSIAALSSTMITS
jgi:hypothetical protein